MKCIRSILIAASLWMIAALVMPASQAHAQDETSDAADAKPNVVFILADNVGYGDMGPYGGGELRGAPTPNVDQLAAEGLKLTQFLVEPACTPTRAALITGQYSIRNGLSLVILGHAAIDAGGAYTYLDTQTGWEFSATSGLTYNFENPDTDYTSGVDWHLDVGMSKFLNEQLFVGLVGYAYVQLTPDEGQPAALGNFESRTFAVGPQIGYNFDVNGVPIYANLRGYYEFDARNRPEGSSVFLTVNIPVSALARN